MKNRIYYNLHKKCLSVQTKVGSSWRVTDHVSIIYLKNVKFKVSEKGRQRVIHEKRKNVHAFIEGELYLCGYKKLQIISQITYNPYEYETFVNIKTKKPVYSADLVCIVGKKVYIIEEVPVV